MPNCMRIPVLSAFILGKMERENPVVTVDVVNCVSEVGLPAPKDGNAVTMMFET